MYKYEFQALIKKYLDGDISVNELKRLVNYYESFQKNNEWVEELGSEEVLKNKMLISILESIETETNVKSIPFYRKSFFKYAVAASLVLFFGISFFYTREGLNSEKSVVNNSIVVGTDKATLTLGDGSNVVLNKGKTFQSGAAKSNGKELVYSKRPKKETTSILYNYLTIPRGGQFSVALSDGSKIWLNSDSQLKYPEHFIEGETRKVELIYGEAYFDISPSIENQNTRFIVGTGKQEVEVLGTEFNIKAYKDESNIYTTLLEGSIVLNNDLLKKKEKLIPGQQAILNKSTNDIVVVAVETKYEIAWKNGLFSFKNKSLKDIMGVLSRWYDVDVQFADEELKAVKFNGQLRKNQELESILELIKNTNFIDAYEIKNDSILLRS